MENILNDYRKRIDIIDNKILNLINKRFYLIKKIALLKQKNNIKLYDSKREIYILKNKINNNNRKNISNNLIFNLFKIIFFESYNIQIKIINNNKYFINKNITIIGGNGNMGKIFFNIFLKKGYNVNSVNSNNWNNNIINNSDLILISVPISKFKIVFDKILSIINNNNCIIVDILSNKINNVSYIMNNYNGPILSLHPMFGPNINNYIKKKILYIDIKYKNKYNWFLMELENSGFILNNIKDIYIHDKYMKYVQLLRYILFITYSKFLYNNNINIKKIIKYSPINNKILIYLITNFYSQNTNIYLEIMKNNNKNVIKIINDIIEILLFIKNNINNNNCINEYININYFFNSNKNIIYNYNNLFNIFNIFNN